MNKLNELGKIAREIESCPVCAQGGTGKPVPGEGTGDVPVMFVGQAPGRTEARTGRPFVGTSGKFLRRMIAGIGLDETSVYITSPVHYLPVSGKPSPAMIEHGRIHLLKQMEIVEPRVVVLLGSVAARALLGLRGSAREHGAVLEKDGIQFLISCHPAYAMRFPEGRRQFVRDFATLKALLAGIV